MPGNVQEFAGVGAPQVRGEKGGWQPAVQLPPEVEAAFSDAVMRRCNQLGITDVKRTIGTFGEDGLPPVWNPT